MVWTDEQIKNHKEVADVLEGIVREVFVFIAKEKIVTERSVQKFILMKFRKHNLKSCLGLPIVAFNEHSALPHYAIGKKPAILKPNTLIMIDIWARSKKRNYPYADITWMAYYGKTLPTKIQRAFDTVLQSRDAAVSFIKSCAKEGKLPEGRVVNEKANAIIRKAGLGKYILHSTGHSIGLRSPHGADKNINKKGDEPLKLNLGYTIEPGIYIPGAFGIRSEIDFYIDEKMKLHITTGLQKQMVFIK
ncbi:MAG: M24 family metallopeptidase [Candidatus Moranbacteria bacterium]|nr:M24 family metallopeptidase [Candidatus Moranbacteria bacterium]